MAIKVYLEEVLKARGMTSKELSALVGITEANLSILRSGKAKGIRFSTINKICYYLNCDVGDILKFDGILIWRIRRTMNKLRRILSVFAAFGILLSLTGCIRLAQEDGDLNGQDRFIGFFITYEYLDLFDHEKYFDDMLSSNKPENLWGKALQSEDYQGRLYAVLSTKTLTEEVTGTTFTTKEYVFEGLQGINFFSACVPKARRVRLPIRKLRRRNRRLEGSF